MRLNSHISKLSTKELKKLTRLIVKWCLDHLGENKYMKHRDLRIELDYNPDETDYAEFDMDEDGRVIRVFVVVNVTIKDFISSVLHEYCHGLQVWYKYDKLYEEYGYKKHPFEKAARKIEERFTHVCWDDIRLKLDKKK